MVDAINDKNHHYEEMCNYANGKGYNVYIAEVNEDLAICASRNIHNFTQDQISKIHHDWEETPKHFTILDLKSLLGGDKNIPEVEIENVPQDENISQENEAEDDEDDDSEDNDSKSAFKLSKWEIMDKEEKMAQLDGINVKAREKMQSHKTIEDWLEISEEYSPVENSKGKKRVHWADLKERRAQAKMRDVGFVVGQTNWNRMMDPSQGTSALTQTKIIPNRFQSQ